ncbi:hypothetical protein HK103_007529 [Boothiomyces macroporosus]|uniref:Ankyrin repeat protein n=1 Tax=Boothiomyces macroporosus TaxID=261099 RepID=A0AAD5Y697_9FUNG|nr:hypothetical protein HK103_007529 [Boothiomyces macroporosus]
MQLASQSINDATVAKLVSYKLYSQITTIKLDFLQVETLLLLLDSFSHFNQDFALYLINLVDKKESLETGLLKGESPILFRLCEEKYYECVKYYVSKGYELGNIPVLFYAVRDNQVDIVWLMRSTYLTCSNLAYGAIKVAIKFKRWNLATVFLNGSQHTMRNLVDLLFTVIESGQGTEFLESLLVDHNVDASLDDNYAIRIASRVGNPGHVELLLKNPTVNPAARNNESLVAAVTAGHLSIVKLLLGDKRVDPSAQNHSALHIAIQNKRLDIEQAIRNAM